MKKILICFLLIFISKAYTQQPAVGMLECNKVKITQLFDKHIITLPYGSGNGAAFSAITMTHNHGSGIDIKYELQAGTLANGSGIFTVHVTGTALSSITNYSFNFVLGGNNPTCNTIQYVKENTCQAPNIACDANWDIFKQTVVSIQIAGSYSSVTGILVNNSNNDGKYYVLTTATPFWFKRTDIPVGTVLSPSEINIKWNAEQSCGTSLSFPPTSTLTTYGATLIARDDAFTNLALLELTQKPPYDYIYYAGWSAQYTIGAAVTCISHSSNFGISGYYQQFSKHKLEGIIGDGASATFAPQYTLTTNNQVVVTSSNTGPTIQVPKWNKGFTHGESGSWGAPLFDNAKQLIGIQIGSNKDQCTDRGPNYFTSISHAFQNNSNVYKKLTNNNPAITQVNALKYKPCEGNVYYSNINNLNESLLKKSANKLTSSAQHKGTYAYITYRAGSVIELNNGFEFSSSNGNILMEISPCDFEFKQIIPKSAIIENNVLIAESEKHTPEIDEFVAYPTIIGDNNLIKIKFSSSEPKELTVKLYDMQGIEVQTLHRENTQYIYEKDFEIRQDIPRGIYHLVLIHGTNTFNSKIIKE